MRLEPCTVSLKGAMLATLGQLTEFRVAFNGSRGSVTLMFGDRRRKRTRGKKPCAPGAVKGGPKPAAQLPTAVPAEPGSSREVQRGPKPVAKPPGRSRLATEAQLLQPGRPGRGLGKGTLLLRPHLGRQ